MTDLDDRDELATHLRDAGDLAGEGVSGEMWRLIHAYNERGEQLKQAMEIVGSVAAYPEYHDEDAQLTILRTQARAVLASTGESERSERHGAD